MSAALVDTETGEVIGTALALPDAGMLELANDPGQQIVLACERANAWLQSGIAVPIESIVETKAQAAALAAFAVQKQLGKDAELAAQEVQRRADRGTSLAVTRAQDQGLIARRGQRGGVPTNGLPRGEDLDSSSNHYRNAKEWADSNVMASVDDDKFNEVIAEAKAEGNLSRTNVARKVKASTTPVGEQVDRIRDLAGKGWHSTQIGKELGLKTDRVKRIANAYDIALTGDKSVSKTHNIDATRVARQTVLDLAAIASSLTILDGRGQINVTRDEAQEWADSLYDSMRALNRFRSQIQKIQKETTHVLNEE